MIEEALRVKEILEESGVSVLKVVPCYDGDMLRGKCPNCGEEALVPFNMLSENTRAWSSCGMEYRAIDILIRH